MYKKIADIILPVIILQVLFNLHPNAIAQDKADQVKGDQVIYKLQQIPDTLEKMLAHALKSSPDIQVAEADILHARAAMKQVRLEVSQAVIEIYHDLKVKESKLEQATKQLSRVHQLISEGLATRETEFEFYQALAEAKAGVARSQAMLRTMIGIEPNAAKTPQTLEDLLAASFKANAEIALADSMLSRMDAKLNQARCKVTLEVTNAFHRRRVHQNAHDMAKMQLGRVQKMIKDGLCSDDHSIEPIQAIIESEAKIMQVEAHIRYLLGLGLEAVRKTKDGIRSK